MSNNYPCPDTGTGCDDFPLPEFDSEFCPEGVKLELSEIKRLFVAEVDPTDETEALGGPSDWAEEADWLTSLDNSDPEKVRYLYGIGDKPEPEMQEATIHDNQTVVLSKTHTVNFDILDMNDTNYEAVRKLQKRQRRRVWFETRGGYLYGGDHGILCSLQARFVKERGAEAFHRGLVEITWERDCDPERVESPIPDSIPSGGE